MKKIITALLITGMLLSSVHVYGFDVIERIKTGESVALPDTVEYEGTLKSVIWDRTKFQSASKGVIRVNGKTSDNEAVSLYIIVEDNEATVTANNSEINFNDKTGKFSANISGTENEYATIFIFDKEDALTDLKSTFNTAKLVHSQTAAISDGKVSFDVDLSEFSGGNYIAYISSGYNVDSTEFEYINYDEFLIEVKKVSVSDTDCGEQIVDLCSKYSLLMNYDLYSVYSLLSKNEQIEIMKKIPQRIADSKEEVDLSMLLDFFNEETAIYKLKNSTYAPTLLEDTVNTYAKALNLDVEADGYYSEMNNKNFFSAYFLSKPLHSKESVQSAFYKGIGITLINEATRLNIKSRLENLNKINGVVSLDISDELKKIESLSFDKQNDIYAIIALKTDFKETTEIKAELNRLIIAFSSLIQNGGGGGSSGGGSSGGGSSGNLGTFGGNAAIAAAAEKSEEKNDSSNIIIYDDIKDAEWARVYINRLSELGVISGYDNKIRPNDPITKEEFAKLIVNAAKLTETADNMSFSDVNPDEWYAQYVSKLYKSGITLGISETEFGTGTYISREDMAVLTYRAMKYINYVENGNSAEEIFNDDADISDYAKDAVYKLRALGIVNGVEKNSYLPKGICSRAMAFKVIAETFYK